jgi:hypothetical protein
MLPLLPPEVEEYRVSSEAFSPCDWPTVVGGERRDDELPPASGDAFAGSVGWWVLFRPSPWCLSTRLHFHAHCRRRSGSYAG